MSASVVSRVVGLGALTAAGQLVIIGSLPLYSRAFEPEVYGHYVIFIGLFTFLSVFAGLRYDSAIVLPRSNNVASGLSGVVVLLGALVAGLIVALTLIAAMLGDHVALLQTLGEGFGYGLALATLIGAIQRSLTGWCVRSNRFLLLGGAQFAFCVVSTVAQLGLAPVIPKLPALLWGYVLGLSVQTLCLFGVFRGGGRINLRLAGSVRLMRNVARRYKRFPTYMVGYALASTVRDRLVQIVLGMGAGAAVVGRFGLASRVVFAPNSLIYSAVSPVFFSLASRGNRASIGRFAGGLVEAGFVVLLVPYVAFAVEAPGLTDTLLGDKWHGTGPYLQALAAPALVLASTCWLDRAFDSFRRQQVAFSLEASFTAIAVVAVLLSARMFNGITVAWIFGVISLVYYWIYFFVAFVACGFPLVSFRRACYIGGAALMGTLAGVAAVHQLPDIGMRVCLYALLMVALIAVWLLLFGGSNSVRLIAKSNLNDTAPT